MSYPIIGIGGLPRSGKDTLAELLVQRGYYDVSLGDIVRDESRVRHKNKPDPISVANMTETSNWLRQTKGADFTIKEAIKRFEKARQTKDYKGVVVYSVRAPAEVDYIQAQGGELIWVDTEDKIRYQRAMDALREGETKVAFDEFKRQEDLQWHPQPNLPPEIQMNIGYVKSQATVTLENNGSDIEAFKDQAEKALELA